MKQLLFTLINLFNNIFKMIFSLDNLILLLFILVSLYFAKGPRNFSYYWFIFNGLWIHLYLDGTVGYW